MANYWIPGQLRIILLVLSGCLVLGTHVAVETHGPPVVCYEPYGCFEPFVTDPEKPLPMAPEEISTAFFLHTAPDPITHQSINDTRSAIENSDFDASKKTKIIIHGFRPTSDAISAWVPMMTEAILTNDDVNVIIVDWVKGAHVDYEQAITNTRIVGAQVANLMRVIMELHDYDPSNFHIIGFSLGAHVAGFAGKEIMKHSIKQKIGRITGLDPAKPGFDYDNTTVRLDKTDASFVDVIHTDISTVLVFASGINRNIGHSDFYPNGGNDQPGCNTWKSGSWVSAVTDMTVCDHLRAPALFMNTINTTDDCDFAAYRCPSYAKFKEGRCIRCTGKKNRKSQKHGRNRCAKMGYWAEPTHSKKQIQYFLQTSDTAPYCAKHYQVQLHWRKGHGSTKDGFRGSLYVQLHGEKGSTEEFALNDGVTFHIQAGKTSRFLVSQDCRKDIGQVNRVTFRWEKPTCWTYFFCPTESVYLKRVKIIDAGEQKRYLFLALPMDTNKDGRKDVVEVPAGETKDLFRKSYIRSRHPDKFVGTRKVERQPPAIPPIVAVEQDTATGIQKGRLLERVHNRRSKGKSDDNSSNNLNSESGQFLSSNTKTHST